MSPRGRPRSTRTREAILDAAIELCNEVGYEALTVEAIATRAGAGKQTIYRWWPSKADVLLDAVVEQTETISPTFPDTGDLRTDLREQMLQVAELLTTSPIGRPLAGLLGAAQWDPDLAEQVLDRIQRPRLAALHDRLRSAVEVGQLRPNLDLGTVIEVLYGPFYHRLFWQNQRIAPDMVDDVLDAVFAGVAPVA